MTAQPTETPQKTAGLQDIGDAIAEARARVLINELKRVLALVDSFIGGWREVIAELDDMSKSEALGKAMWACLNQIDLTRKEIRAALAQAKELQP